MMVWEELKTQVTWPLFFWKTRQGSQNKSKYTINYDNLLSKNTGNKIGLHEFYSIDYTITTYIIRRISTEEYNIIV